MSKSPAVGAAFAFIAHVTSFSSGSNAVNAITAPDPCSGYSIHSSTLSGHRPCPSPSPPVIRNTATAPANNARLSAPRPTHPFNIDECIIATPCLLLSSRGPDNGI